jgi:membrane-bound lytic murein transglycosylase B
MTKIKHLMLLILLFLITGCVQKGQQATVQVPDNTVYYPQQPPITTILPQQQYPIAQTYPIAPTYPIETIQPSNSYPHINNSPFNNLNTVTTVVDTPEPSYHIQRSQYLGGAYRSNYTLKKFINMMVSKHNYDRYTLNSIFSTVSRDTEALKKYNVFKTAKPTYNKATRVGSWDKYRSNFITDSRINKGVAFWRENINHLNRAAQKYGVAPEYIVGIIGVETNFGGYTGTHSVMNALTTLAIEFKKRSKFFKGELESYLLMIRDEKLDPQKIKGSYAGAFGLAQFMPTAFRQHAVDFNGDGHINLFNKADAIGSIAKYFLERGKWNNRIPVVMKTYYNKKRFYGLSTGFKSSYSQKHMKSLGMRPSSSFYGYRGNVSLIKLSRYTRDELWWGTKNFYAITRYNPKDHYAMAVHQLAQAVRKAYYRR